MQFIALLAYCKFCPVLVGCYDQRSTAFPILLVLSCHIPYNVLHDTNTIKGDSWNRYS